MKSSNAIEICVVTKAWRSGAAWVAQMLVQGLADEGTRVGFIAPKADPESREPRSDHVVRCMLPRELVGEYPRWRRALASLSRIGASLANVCVMRMRCHSFVFSIPEPLVFTLPLLVLLRISGAHVIYIVHDAKPHAWKYTGMSRRIEGWANASVYRSAEALVVLTPTVQHALVAEFATPPGKITVIPHGPFLLSEVRPVPGSGRLLVFGSLRRNKCILESVEAVLYCRSRGHAVQLVLAGEPLLEEPGYWEECLRRIATDPDGFDVKEGFFPDEALPSLIGSVDAFLLPYKDFHSQSGVAILAAFARRPIIGTRSGGIGELFDLGVAHESIHGEVTSKSISAAILNARSVESNDWRRRCDEGFDAASKTLNWRTIGRSYLAVSQRRKGPTSNATAR